MTKVDSRWSVVVVRPQVTWFARAGRKSEFHPTVDWARTNLPRVVMAAGAIWFPAGGEGVVLWQCREAVDTRRMVDTLRGHGCKVSDAGHETGWFTVRRDGCATVHLGISSMISQMRTTIIRLNGEAKRCAERLAQYADLTGAAWRGTAGMSGCAGIRATHETKVEGAQPLWRWDDARAAKAIRCSWELRGSRHNRAMTTPEIAAEHVHQFDVRAMYCAAAGVAMCGWSAPEPRGPQEFDPGRPGYWQVRYAEVAEAPRELVKPTDGMVWLTTPVMAYLVEIGITTPEVHDSWTAQRGGRYLKPWAERLTAALRQVPEQADPSEPGVKRALKDTYKRTVGMMAREGGRIFRPDWRDEVVDRARVNLLRKTARCGYTPLRYNVDAVWIVTDHDARTVGRALGVEYNAAGAEVWQVGKFRHIESTTPTAYLERYERRALMM